MRRGNVLVLHPADAKGPLWSLVEINMDDYRDLNDLVKGNLGMCTLPRSIMRLGFLAYCDDDALIRSDPPAPNGFAPHLGHPMLRGPIVVVRVEGELEIGLDEADVNFWAQYLLGPPSGEAKQLALLEAMWWEKHPSGMVVENFESVDDFFKKLDI